MLGHRRKAARPTASGNPSTSLRNDEESGGGRQSRDPSPSHFGVLNLDSYNHHHHPHRGGQGLDRLFLSMTHGPRRYRQFGSVLVPWLRKSWWIPLILFLFLVNSALFYIRYFTMSRPSWLYGSPIPYATVQACLGSAGIIKDSSSLSGTSTTTTTVPLQFLPAKDPSLYWEWHRFSTNASSSVEGPNHKPRHRLLIAQYSGYGTYAQLLDIVAPMNAAYAQYWNCDFVLLQGTALAPSTPVTSATTTTKACPSEPRSTFNKIAVLDLVQEQYRDRYDMVLILDTDTMIVDFQTDISTLLPSSSSTSSSTSPSPYLLAAHRVWSWDWRNTWDINAGITLWNIHHEKFVTILDQWKGQVLEHPFLVAERNDDQYFLQSVLLQQQQQDERWWTRLVGGSSSLVYSLTQEFNYYQGTVIQHFKRESSSSWSASTLEQRLARIQETIHTLPCSSGPSGTTATMTEGATTTTTAAAATTTIPCPYPLTTKFAERQANQ